MQNKHFRGGGVTPKQIKSGFTLTEVIVVIVIIAALAIILIPNMLSLMPDDHNIKYKKAFYTMQEVIDGIAQECQVMRYDDGKWYTIEEWNDKNPSNQLNSEYILNFCYDSSNNMLNIAKEICERLSTTEDCSTYRQISSDGQTYHYINIQTTNGMKWSIPAITIGNAGGFSKNWEKYIFVNVDGKDIVSIDQTLSEVNMKKNPEGTYKIKLNVYGKVSPGGATEKKLLLDNPTKD